MERPIDLQPLLPQIKNKLLDQTVLNNLPKPKFLKGDGEALGAFDFEYAKLTVYSNGDIEITGPVYAAIVERYDYSTIEEAVSLVVKQVLYIDSNLERLRVHPELRPEPLLDRLLKYLKLKFGL